MERAHAVEGDRAAATGRAGRPGLRERKKTRTREALVEAAVRLTRERGFDATTTAEIAEEAGVSQRTLFRYFPCKEDVLLSVQDGVDSAFRDELRERPADEPPLLALRRAFTASAAAVGEPVLSELLRTVPLYDRSPQLLAARLRRGNEHMELLARIIAERTGTDPRTDPRPRLVASAFGSAVHVAFDLHSRQDRNGPDELVSLVEHTADTLVPALTTWHTAAHHRGRDA
ncbi:TetR family transcriptional regulator [Haloactinospora alba]|uniref:TetR family transcriptional regulator n=1 Tax=Haloactinospora alba TaxID=405555 RepID=A0A543NGJ4_9ACTN|nr:TetR family transcriptional regulator [Haloactinospora alba]TQN30975.1 TetR family transcriptional regulator [Haloactinospora alba]